MKRFISRSVVVAALAIVGVALLAPSAQAQVRPVVSGRAFPSIQSRYPPFAPTQLQQAALRNWSYNTAVIGRTYAQLPPWLFYNPYPQVINYGPVYRAPIYPVPYSPNFYTPYYPRYESGFVSPYANPYGVAPINPYYP